MDMRKNVIETCKKSIDSGKPAMDYSFYFDVIELLESIKLYGNVIYCDPAAIANMDEEDVIKSISYSIVRTLRACGLLQIMFPKPGTNPGPFETTIGWKIKAVKLNEPNQEKPSGD